MLMERQIEMEVFGLFSPFSNQRSSIHYQSE